MFGVVLVDCVEISINFNVFYCIQVYYGVGDVCVQLVEQWFVLVDWYIGSYYFNVCVDGIVVFVQGIYIGFQFGNDFGVWCEEWVVWYFVLVYEGDLDIVQL